MMTVNMGSMKAPHFSAALNKALEASGYTKYRLAQLSGVSEGLISQLASGKQKPSDKTVKKLSDALGASYDLLLAAAWADRHGADSLALVRGADRPMQASAGAGIPEGSSGHAVPRGYRDSVTIPRYGPVACGDFALLPTDDHADTVSIPAHWAEGADAAFIVRGSCLSGKRILDGDELLVKRLNGERPFDGAIVIVEAEGVYSAKIYRCNELGEYLETHEAGKAPQPQKFPDDTRLVGRVVRWMIEA